MNCTVEDCTRQAKHRGMCSMHYQRARNAAKPPCKEEGCGRKHHSSGYCAKHYTQHRREDPPVRKPKEEPTEPTNNQFDTATKASPYRYTNEVINKYLLTDNSLWIVQGPAGRKPITAGGADEAKQIYINKYKEDHLRLHG